jgi:hypothetical protein
VYHQATGSKCAFASGTIRGHQFSAPLTLVIREPKVRSRTLGRNPDHGAEQFDQLPIAEERINNFKVKLGLTQARLP